MLLSDLKNYMNNVKVYFLHKILEKSAIKLIKSTSWFDRLYEYCRYFQKQDKLILRLGDEWFVFYTLNEIFGYHLHETMRGAFEDYLQIEDPTDSDSKIFIEKLLYINEFFILSSQWQDVCYTAIMGLLDRKMKDSMKQLDALTPTLDSFEAHFKQRALKFRRFFCDQSEMDGLLLHLSYNIHYYYLLYKMPMLETYLMNKDDDCVHIKELAKCIKVTNRQDVIAKKFLKDISPRLLHIGNSTTTILDSCNLLLANSNDIDESGQLSKLICVPIVDYLKTRKDLIKSIVSSISASETFHEDFVRSENAPQNCWFIYNNTIRPEPPSDSDDESLNQPLNFNSITLRKKTANTSVNLLNKTFQTKRIRKNTFDLLNSYIFIVGNARTFMTELRKYLMERILPFNADNFIEKEKVLLEFLLKCFGKELVYDCFVMLSNVADSVAKVHKRYDKRKKMAIDCIITTPSVWPDLSSSDQFVVPPFINNYAQKIERDYALKHPNRYLEWYPNQDILEMTVVVEGVKRTFLASPSQGTILLLFNKNVILSYDDLLKKSSIKNMDSIKQIVLHWILIGVIVSVGENQFQLTKSFT